MESKLYTWINEQAESRGWSQNELGRRAGLSSSAISLVMSGQRRVNFGFCLAIAGALGERPEKVMRIAGLLPPSAGQMQDLSEDEAELVALYRQIDNGLGRDYLLTFVRGLVDKHR